MKHEISGGYMELTVRVIIADDHPTVLLGIKHALVAGKTIDVVGMAKNSHELIRMLAVEECDVLVTDYSMPGGDYGDGLPLLGLIQRSHPHLHIVVMTMMDNPALLKTLLKNGVRCLVHKSDDVMHLIPAVHAAHAGGQYLSPAITAMQHLFNAIEKSPSEERGLTPRELEVVRLFVAGMTVNEIAGHVHRSKQTISSQKNTAMKKLGIERDADLFKYALEFGFL